MTMMVKDLWETQPRERAREREGRGEKRQREKRRPFHNWWAHLNWYVLRWKLMSGRSIFTLKYAHIFCYRLECQSKSNRIARAALFFSSLLFGFRSCRWLLPLLEIVHCKRVSEWTHAHSHSAGLIYLIVAQTIVSWVGWFFSSVYLAFHVTRLSLVYVVVASLRCVTILSLCLFVNAPVAVFERFSNGEMPLLLLLLVRRMLWTVWLLHLYL